MSYRLENTTRRIYDNLFFLCVLIVGPLIFWFVPQVHNIWWSQEPPTGVDPTGSWQWLWLAFAVLLILGIAFFGISVFVVPRPAKGKPKRLRECRAEMEASGNLQMFGAWAFGWIREGIDEVVALPSRIVDSVGPGLRLTGGAVILLGSVAMIIFGPRTDSTNLYLLDGACLNNIFWWCAIVATWMLVCRWVLGDSRKLSDQMDDGDPRYPLLLIAGRFLAWLFVSFAFAELLWICSYFSATSVLVSYRAYAVWMILHMWGVAAVLAGSLDYLDVHMKWVPLRLVAAVTVVVLLLVIRPEANSDVTILGSAKNGTSVTEPYDAYDHLEVRLRTIPEGEPVVIVAASGGGSRAAIFTALTYEFLARTELPPLSPNVPSEDQPKRYWSDNIALISCVSGGSLATAHFVNRNCTKSTEQADLNYTITKELHHGIKRWIESLTEEESERLAHDETALEEFEMAKARAQVFLKTLLASDSSMPNEATIVHASFVDEMGMNYMAPILRGANTVGLYRGDALARFWEYYYDWPGQHNLQQAAEDKTHESRWWTGNKPVVIFNACDVGKGSRLAIGFPSLPAQAFDTNDEDDGASRLHPTILSKLYPPRQVRISMADAVQLSSNFPWAFHASIIEDPSPPMEPLKGNDEKPTRTLVLDGGISDNTGIDTLYEFIRGLDNTNSPRGRRILNLLRERPILLLEIDSGGKPSPPTGFDQLFGVALEPIKALNNAGYANAELTKEHYMHRLVDLLAYDAELERAPGEVCDAKPHNIVSLTLQCNHFSLRNPDRNAVMTAFALSPSDKANVVARFAIEIDKFESSLQGLAKLREKYHEWKRVTDLAYPDFARRQLRSSVEGTQEFADRLNVIVDPIQFEDLDEDQRKEIEIVVQPYRQAAQQIEEFRNIAERSTNKDALPGISADKLKDWSMSWQTKLSENIPDDLSRSPVQVQQLPEPWRNAVKQPSRSHATQSPDTQSRDRRRTLDELQDLARRIDESRRRIEKKSRQSKKWFRK